MKLRIPLLSRRTYNILVIEDMPSWQRNFRRYLQEQPFNVYIAKNRNEALDLVQNGKIDVVILDVNLSGVPYNVDGLRLADKMWQHNNNLKIIIVSGSREWDIRLKNYSFHPSFILEKQNLDQDDLIDKIYQTVR